MSKVLFLVRRQRQGRQGQGEQCKLVDQLICKTYLSLHQDQQIFVKYVIYDIKYIVYIVRKISKPKWISAYLKFRVEVFFLD